MKVACGRPRTATAICRQLHQICVESVDDARMAHIRWPIVRAALAFCCGSSLQ